MNKKYCIIITTTDNNKTAMLIAKTLIGEKLSPCVQLDKISSIFYEEDSYKEADEIRLFIKAKTDNYKAIEKSILLNHNYKLPQIIKLDIKDGLPEYLDWIDAY